MGEVNFGSFATPVSPWKLSEDVVIPYQGLQKNKV